MGKPFQGGPTMEWMVLNGIRCIFVLQFVGELVLVNPGWPHIVTNMVIFITLFVIILDFSELIFE